MNRQEVPWFPAIVAELLSQLDDDLVQGAGSAIIIVTPYLIEQAIARKDLARMVEKGLQQFQFSGGQFLDDFAALKLEGFAIDGRAPNLKASRRLSRSLVAGRAAAHQGMNPGQQLAQSERFGDVIISAQVQADHFINLLAFGGEHQ